MLRINDTVTLRGYHNQTFRVIAVYPAWDGVCASVTPLTAGVAKSNDTLRITARQILDQVTSGR